MFVIAVGPLDERNTPLLLDACRGHARIEIDLTGVTTASHTGVAVLLDLAQSSTLCILSASPVMRGAIDAANLSHVLRTNGTPCELMAPNRPPLDRRSWLAG